MRVFVAVNVVSEIGYRQTTAMLIAAMARRGCDVWLASVDTFSLWGIREPPRVTCNGYHLPKNCTASKDVASFVRAIKQHEAVAISEHDTLLIRTNPGRDLARAAIHQAFLHFCELAERQGTRVVNSPTHLARFAHKSSLVMIAPRFRPPMIVSGQIDAICDFVRDAPAACVVKPLLGSRGQNVIQVSKEQVDLEVSIASTFGGMPVVTQHFVEVDRSGDRRILTLDGSILEVNGHVAGIERRPANGDFRANLHAGGTAHPVSLNETEREAATHAARLLMQYGIRLVGVDLIGGQIIELNVFSTGGVYDAVRFSHVDFADAIVDSLIPY